MLNQKLALHVWSPRHLNPRPWSVHNHQHPVKIGPSPDKLFSEKLCRDMVYVVHYLTKNGDFPEFFHFFCVNCGLLVSILLYGTTHLWGLRFTQIVDVHVPKFVVLYFFLENPTNCFISANIVFYCITLHMGTNFTNSFIFSYKAVCNDI